MSRIVGGGGGGGGENMTYCRAAGELPVKVVIINTQYVQTDATSFKSVVQSLTGKDSVIPTARNMLKSSSSSSSSKKKKRKAAMVVDDQGGGNNSSNNNNNQIKPVVLAKGMSFKDLDRLLMELPSMDELYHLCAD